MSIPNRVVRYVSPVLVIVATICSPASCQSIDWRDDLKRAAKESEIYGKPLLVYLSTSWCGYCRKMERETFTSDAVKAKITSDLIPVSLDGEKYRSFSRKVGVRGFPTSVVMDAKMRVKKKISGFRTAKQFTNDLAKFGPDDSLRLSVYGKACPVEPKENGRFAIGRDVWGITHRGYHVQFASQKNRELFRENPDEYWPAMDGFCVVSQVDDGRKRLGRLEHASLFGGRAWFFASADHKEKFDKHAKRYAKSLEPILKP